MEKYEIQKLRDLPIEKVAKQMRMVLKHHKALCPFHDDHHASLSFNTRKNSCRCYVCMRDSMGTIDLVMKFLGKDFISACRGKWGLSGRFASEGGFFFFPHLSILFLIESIFGRFFRNFFEGISGGITILLLRCREVCEIL